jgi:hypothetical protein
VRARIFEMRLLAAGLTALWAATSLLVLVGYRPGGPADLLVGVALLVPVGISAVALRWPPAPRGQMTYRVVASLAVGTGLILLPSLAGVWRQITDRGLQTLLPSPEAGYPWALAILGTSLFAALGPTRLLLAPGARRRTRLTASLGAGLAIALVTSTLVASVAVGNDRALAGRPAGASRFGPTDPKELPPRCDAPIAVGSTAQLEMVLGGTIDGHSIGGALVRGARAGADFSWTSEVASVEALGLGGAALVGTQGWLREPGGSWQRVPGTQVGGESLDVAVLGDGLDTTARAAAEDLGFDYLEGADSRHCRLAIDGDTFRRAFPQVRWLAGDADLHRWRGEIDYWIFGDAELGRADGWIAGEGFTLQPGAIQGRLEASLTATSRGSVITIVPPAP